MVLPPIQFSCPFGLNTNSKKMRRPPKIEDSCIILSVFNIKKMKTPLENICIKVKNWTNKSELSK